MILSNLRESSPGVMVKSAGLRDPILLYFTFGLIPLGKVWLL